MTDREKMLDKALTYIGRDGYYVCRTKLRLGSVYDWCAFAVSAIMKDCGFIGKYIKSVEGGAGSIPRASDGKYGTWFKKGAMSPQPGDLIFLRYADYPQQDKYFCDHIGIVENVKGTEITTLEGNVDGYGYNWASTSSFKRKTRSMNDSNVYAFYRPKWQGSTSTGTTSQNTGAKKKTVDELAKEVIQDKWSVGDDRKAKLTAAGYDYSAVQTRVNEMLSGKVQNKKSVDTLAREVIQGKWGAGDDRKNRLTAAGYDYYAVQNRVNELMR